MLLRRNRDERAEKARFPFEDIEIRQRAKAGAELAQPHAPHILRRRHRVALGLDPHMQGDKQRPFAVEALGDDNEVVGVEHFPGTDDRVEGTETGIVQYDIRGIDAAFNQVPTHGHRFIVALQSIIAAQQEIVDLAAVVGVQRTLDAVTVILIDDAGAVIFGGAQHHTDLTVGQVLQFIIDIGRGFPAHPAVKAQHGQQQQAEQD